jgi:hypothetical protein
MTEPELRTLKASHDHAVALGAVCPADCVFRTTSLRTAAEETHVTDYASPDPYREPIAKLKAAESTPESHAEDDYKAARTAEFAAEHARFAARRDETPEPRLTAAELSDYVAPDLYKAGLDKMRSGSR